jgi:hypothetical protein
MYTRMFALVIGCVVACVVQGRLTGLSGSVLPSEWQLPWWYRASCFSYTFAGLTILGQLESLEDRLSCFPWEVFGTLLFFNGVTSYAADVLTWGHASVWKMVDVWLASCDTLLTVALLGMCSLPSCTLPALSRKCVALGVLLALWSKRHASFASTPDAFFCWHTMWHVSLPLCGVVAVVAATRPTLHRLTRVYNGSIQLAPCTSPQPASLTHSALHRKSGSKSR